MNLIQRTFQPTGRTHSATVIFLHGSGDTGHNLIEWIRFLIGRDIEFPHIKMVFPTAPVQPYSPMDGMLSNVWFDRKAIDIKAKESRSSMAKAYHIVNDLIAEEVKSGISPNRIVFGGFSMGGALSLHAGYHVNQELGGVFGLSSFLNNDSIVYESLQNRKDLSKPLPKLLMFHGERDSLVHFDWGKKTFDELKKFNMEGDFIPLKNTMHELKHTELTQLVDWIGKTLPPLDSDLNNKL